MMSVALFGAAAFLASLALTGVCGRLARRLGVVATPRADRWHREPVPLLGGVAIAVPVCALGPLVPGVGLPVIGFIGGAVALALFGLVDDLHALKPHTKLAGQIVVASAMTALGLQLRLTPYPLLNLILTLVWVVGVTNAFNLLDNMDGLAAGIAVIAAGYRMAFLVADGNMAAAALAAVFIGAVLGFLVRNFPPASIFMGDAGSLFIGFFVSGLSLTGGWPYSRSVVSVLLFPVLIALVPIFDTTFVTISRLLARRPVSVGGRDHTSHRLVALGLTERRAVLSLYVVALVSGSVASFTYRFGLSYSVVFIAFLALGLVIFGLYLARIHVYPDEHAATAAPGTFFDLVVTLTQRRQAATVLVDVLLIVLAYYSAYLLRFEDRFRDYRGLMVHSLPIVIGCQVLVFALFRVHHGIWRYTGVKDLVRVVEASGLGTAGAVVVLVFLYRFDGYSRAVFVLDWILLVVFVSAARLSFRVLGEYLRPALGSPSRVLLYGAGEAGMLVFRELHNNPALGRWPVGFVDDDPRKQRRAIHGVHVLGGCDELPDLIHKHHVTEVLVASTKITADRLHRLETICERQGVRVMRASFRLE